MEDPFLYASEYPNANYSCVTKSNNTIHYAIQNITYDCIPAQWKKNNEDKDEYITNHYQELMGLYYNENYDEVNIMLNPNYGSSLDLLFKYCVDHNDVKLLSIIISNHKNDFCTLCHYFGDTINSVIFDNNINMFRLIFENTTNFPSTNEQIFNSIVDNGEITFLTIMEQNNLRMGDHHLKNAIVNNKINIIQYAIINNYDVSYCIDYVLNGKMPSINIHTLTLLANNNINVQHILNAFKGAILNNDIQTVTFCVENYNMLEEATLNIGLCLSCQHNYIDIMLYLLRKGADIQSLPEIVCMKIQFNTMQFMIQNDYHTHVSVLNHHLLKCFIHDKVMDNIYYLISVGAQIEEIFNIDKKCENTSQRLKIDILNVQLYHLLSSPFEYIVSMGEIQKLEFLINNHFNELQPEINRLLVIAVANGQFKMALYLYDLGAILNDKLLYVACFFGHFDMIKLLLELGMDFNNITENLFSIVNDGHCRTGFFRVHKYVTDNNVIFRNYVFNYGGKYLKILKLLIKHNVPIPNHDDIFFSSYKKEFCDIGIIEYFISNGLNIHKKIDNQYPSVLNGCNLTEGCVIFGNVPVVRSLLEYGAVIDMTIKSVYREAIGNKEMMDLLQLYEINCDPGNG